jgi:hypothetical protein
VQSGDEIRLWVVDGIAHNLRPWFTKFNGKVIDKRWLKVVEELYGWHYRKNATCATIVRWREWRWSIRNRPPRFMAVSKHAPEWKITRWLLSGLGRSACAV